MPAGNIVLATTTDALLLGVQSTFVDAYNTQGAEEHPLLKECMAMGLPSDGLYESYAYPEVAPYPVNWKRGNPVPSGAFKFRGWSVTNYDYGRKIPWNRNDQADDRTKSLMSTVSSLGSHWATLQERFFFEVLTGTASVLPAIPTCPDGASLFSTTDGDSAARFGVTDGNVVSGGGVTTGALIRTDVWKAYARFMGMLDTQGQPLHNPTFLQKGVIVVHSVALLEVMAEAFDQSITSQVVSTSNAGVSNTLHTSNIPVTRWASPRLSGNSFYVFARGSKHKAIFEQTRQPLTIQLFGQGNDRISAETKEDCMIADSRHGVGTFLPYMAVKVSNS
jgi:hypothetical protein